MVFVAVRGFTSDYIGDLGTVVVTPSRYGSSLAELATNVSVINRHDIEESGALTAAEALKKRGAYVSVGIRGTRGSESSARIRSGGATANQVLVMVDGQPVNDVALGEADLDKIAADHIEQIEIARGPFSAVWGADALGGVINIITRSGKNDLPKTALAARAGSFNSRKYSLNHSFSYGENSIYTFVSEESSDGFRENSAYRGNDFMINAGRKINGYGDLNLRFSYHKSESGVPGPNYTDVENYDGERERASSTPEASMDTLKRYLQIESVNALFNSIELKSRLYGSFIDITDRAPSRMTEDLMQTQSYGGNIQALVSEDVLLGLEVEHDNFIKTDKEGGVKEIDENMLNAAIYLQKRMNFTNLQATFGGRYDHHSVWGGAFNPRLSVVYNLSDKIKVSGNAGRAFRAPTFNDLYYPESSWPASEWGPAGDSKGNREVEPETAWGYDVGLEKELGIALGRITFFRSDIDDMIEWVNVSDEPDYEKWRPVNVEKARNRGIEAELKASIFPGITLNVAYRYLDSKGKSEGDSDYKTLQYTVPNKINAGLGCDFKFGLKVNAGISWNDKAKWEGGSIDEHTLLDFRVSQQIANAEIFAAIDNISDTRYKRREGFPLPGREVSAGVKMKF